MNEKMERLASDSWECPLQIFSPDGRFIGTLTTADLLHGGRYAVEVCTAGGDLTARLVTDAIESALDFVRWASYFHPADSFSLALRYAEWGDESVGLTDEQLQREPWSEFNPLDDPGEPEEGDDDDDDEGEEWKRGGEA
jgi:hypothetical protein